MTVVSNHPSLLPIINSNILLSYWTVAAGVVVLYDWVLTLGKEIELIWRQRWSLMTVLYLVTRYIAIPYSVGVVLLTITSVSLTDAGCNILFYARGGINSIVTAMLGVIMIARLHAMCQGSRMMFIFLVVIFLAVNIACAVITAIALSHTVAKELIVSGTRMCSVENKEDSQPLPSMICMLNTIWEVLALCLSVWIAVKHFLDLRRLGPSTGSTIGNCFRVLMKSHVLYFASFFSVSCIQFITLSPESKNPDSTGTLILNGALQIFLDVQMFVLGPRLILSVRQYHAKLVVESVAQISMNLIVFQGHIDVPTSSTV